MHSVHFFFARRFVLAMGFLFDEATVFAVFQNAFNIFARFHFTIQCIKFATSISAKFFKLSG